MSSLQSTDTLVGATFFFLKKKKKNELIFLDREDSDFLLKAKGRVGVVLAPLKFQNTPWGLEICCAFFCIWPLKNCFYRTILQEGKISDSALLIRGVGMT